MSRRVYLDWNASAPLRPEARDAMLAAMDEVGNPSSVHAEGRRAKAIVERARAQVARLLSIEPDRVVFTSGATEAAALACAGRRLTCADIEHDAVHVHRAATLRTAPNGEVPESEIDADLLGLQAANSETGVLQNNFAHAERARAAGAQVLTDAVQAASKVRFSLADHGAHFLMLSAHKIGGPRGVGALCLDEGVALASAIPGGGQEQGRRSGTENVVCIAGFGAVAEAALADQRNGVWDRVENLRDSLENALEAAAPDLLIFGKDAPRLPNTSCFAVPGWKGETQVMQMDLAGFAVSAGSACSSGKVNKASRVLLAIGFDETTASSAIRVSLGPTNTEAEVRAFADAWEAAYTRWKARAA